MTDPSSPNLKTPAPAAAPAAQRESVPSIPQPRSLVLPVLYCLGFAILAGAITWIWQNPPSAPQAPAGALYERLDALEARLVRLEARPPEAAQPAGDLAPLLARLSALEAKAPAPAEAPDLAPIEARLAALEARPVPPPDAALNARIDRLARLQAAAAALEAGQKLGALPDAPPALQAFADTDPPTEAGLRLAFPVAARAALLASRPIDPDLPALSRIWGRLQELITIRQGDRVLVGDPAAGVLATAQHTLDAGDLAGTILVLERLNPSAAQAMAGWTDQARALSQARAALAAMAARG